MLYRTQPLAWSGTTRTSFARVFAGTDPSRDVFTSSIPSRRLLYPLAYLLDEAEFLAVSLASKALGEESMLLSVVEEFDGNDGEKARHWELGHSFADYCHLPEVGVLENAIYSPQGSWGLMISSEQHALLGGNAEFVETVIRQHTKWRESEAQFRVDWEWKAENYAVDISWTNELLASLH